MLERFRTFLVENMPWGDNTLWVDASLLLAIALVAIATYYMAKLLLYGVEYLVAKSKITWDDDLLNDRMLRALSQLAPALAVNQMLPAFFDNASALHRWIKILTAIYVLCTVIYIVFIFIDNVRLMLSRQPRLSEYSMGGVFGMLKLIAVGIGVIVGLSILFGKEPSSILTAIGASAAVLMLVFKDTILGLVASVQFSVNKMLREGDWIVAESHGVNGEVLKVSLTTVKIRNWDNSISTIPPYTLVSDSFRNYQAMRESGGRRIDRSVLIDASSVGFLDGARLDELQRRGWLEGLGMERARSVVNLQLLRRYLEAYLAADERVNHDMICMVRQLELTPTGVPLQLYFFTLETEWKAFEQIQSDIFDHVYAIINEFGLRVFQSPTGADIQKLTLNS